jgi:hypothetical protein
MVQQVATTEPYAPPSAREARAQAVHRLQVGLLGLCAMLLLVGLANIIMDRARLADADNPVPEATEGAAKPATDPLADIGVVPAADPSFASDSGKGP